jgi:hypothetical protein
MTRLVPLLGLAALLGACGPRYETIRFELKSQPPLPVRLDADLIEIPAGIAVAVHATLESSARLEYVPEDPLALKSRDPAVLRAEATPGAHNFVLIGVAVGETCLAVEVEYEEEECIPVRVIDLD